MATSVPDDLPVGGDWLSGQHHARYIQPDVAYHVIVRVFQGWHLLKPTKELNHIIVGVLSRAREQFPDVKMYALSVLSNHLHAQLQGPPDQLPHFVGYVAREVSRRWGTQRIRWPGKMFEQYIATALPTPESRLQCLRYILSQGVKEGLGSRPERWPGVHCAKHLLSGRPLKGLWFNGTAYAKAKDVQSRTQHPRPVRKNDYYQSVELSLDTLPDWQHLSEPERHQRIAGMLDEIEREGRAIRNGKAPVGARRILASSRYRRTALPALPWLQRGRTMVCWANPRDPEVQLFLHGYWIFQRAFRAASNAYLRGEPGPRFPPGSFRPPKFEPRVA